MIMITLKRKDNIMKKIILALAIVLTLGLGANAQYFNGGKDGFFNDWEDLDNGLERTDLPELPSAHGQNTNQSAPLGSGLIILGAMGSGYAMAKRRREE
jgi:hypothetical protein